ncbi:hypothetical protein E1285_31060 [Actinomadura sp. 7K507]|nr:hypothetical protein E1285_31060 [Actinomadura sp. 7K507]
MSNFQLRPNSNGTGLQDRADALPLVKGTVTGIMNDLNRQGDDPTGTGEACEPDALESGSPAAISRSVCFQSDDNNTTQWFPQGVTTVADMQADQEWGDGYQPVLVSWYDKTQNDAIKGVRISFMDPASGAYRHVLLVYPQANGSYDTVRVSQDPSASGYGTSLHAGGIVWYGNYLFVADTARGFRMFDMRRIFDLGASENGSTADGNKVGLHGGTYHGHGYRYVMPQIGSWTRTAPTGTKCTTSDGSPQFSHASLDRSGTDHLVAGEYCAGGEAVNGRVAAWPIAGAFDGNELVMDTSYRWNADAAHKLPDSNVQGATRFDGRWYLSRSRGDSADGTLYTTEPATGSTTTLQIASQKHLSIGPEDLSHWQAGTDPSAPGLGHLWTVAEHPAKRMVYSVQP